MLAPCLKSLSWERRKEWKGPVLFPTYSAWLICVAFRLVGCFVVFVFFFWYSTKSFIQAAYITGVFLCAAQESSSLERQDWSSCSCPLLVLMQRVSCTFRKILLPRLILCMWRGWSKAGGFLLQPDPFQHSLLVTLSQNYSQQGQYNHWVWISTDSYYSREKRQLTASFSCPRNLL